MISYSVLIPILISIFITIFIFNFYISFFIHSFLLSFFLFSKVLPLSRELSNISNTKPNKKDFGKKVSKTEISNQQKITESYFLIDAKNKKNKKNDNNDDIVTEVISEGRGKRVKSSHETKAGFPTDRRPTLIRG